MTNDDDHDPGGRPLDCEAELRPTVVPDLAAWPFAIRDDRAGSLIGRVLDGKYRVEAMIGRGGMGEVYRAMQFHLDRLVAVKLVLGAFRDGDAAVGRFKREAVAVARLRHPNIVTVYDFGIAEGVGAYLVMEYLEGWPLREEVGTDGGPPVARAVELLRQVCSAVQAAHEAGVVHRDLKPDNVIVANGPRGPTAKVVDFGIAKLVEEPTVAAPTSPGVAMGTPVYMAPEQCKGKEVDARTDVYALGVMLYELLVGVPPFLGSSFAQMMYLHVHELPVPPSARRPGVPPALEAVALRALAKAPDDRYASAEAFGEALAGALAGALSLPAPSGRGAAVAMPTGRHAADDAATVVGAALPTAPPSNLPEHVTSFVGRAREVAGVARAIGEARVLTLTGLGGIGKTRLALRVASEVASEYPDGVWLVELAPVSDPALVAAATADVLAVQSKPGRPLVEALCDAVRDRRMLLLLDNCEHLLEACAALVGALVRVARGVRVLATSREVLGVEGETVWAVPPLPLPPRGSAAGALEAADSVALLVARARLARADFELTERNAEAAAELCRRLDGIPLAIELAAARVRSLSLDQILARMGDRFRLLTEGPRTAAARQRTLRAAVDWSYELLTEDERSTLRRLAVFAGGWTLEAAEAVCAGGTVDELAVLDLLGRLVDKSLVVAVEDLGREPRYRMLETIRAYARERLVESGEENDRLKVYGQWFATLARSAASEFGGQRHVEWVERMKAEQDNLQAVFQWCLGGGCGAEEGLGMTVALLSFWSGLERLGEGLERVEAALATWPDGPPDLRASVLFWGAALNANIGDYGRATSYSDACIALRRDGGESADLAKVLSLRAEIALRLGDFRLATSLLEESLDVCRAAGLPTQFASATYALGLAAYYANDLGRARAYLEDAVARCRDIGRPFLTAIVLCSLGDVLRLEGELDRAVVCLEEYGALAKELGHALNTADYNLSLGRLLADLGQYEQAGAAFAESAATYRDEGSREELVELVEGWAVMFARRGEVALALCLEAAAATTRQQLGIPRRPVEQAELDRALAASPQAPDGEERERARARGRGLTIQEAVDCALAGPLDAGPRSEPGE